MKSKSLLLVCGTSLRTFICTCFTSNVVLTCSGIFREHFGLLFRNGAFHRQYYKKGYVLVLIQSLCSLLLSGSSAVYGQFK